jgi:hypothetical protein
MAVLVHDWNGTSNFYNPRHLQIQIQEIFLSEHVPLPISNIMILDGGMRPCLIFGLLVRLGKGAKVRVAEQK